eukprot:c20763_g9_i4.p1 GENE.c20763_g9_i4~~c20763_g9_i4.p1  ORF type:complete len:458 (+),score=80.61 c20763_g9_i4:154-1527(+)
MMQGPDGKCESSVVVRCDAFQGLRDRILELHGAFRSVPVCECQPISHSPHAASPYTALMTLLLLDGRFYKGSKKVQQNVEAVVTLRNHAGDPLPDCFAIGPTGQRMTRYRSPVLYHLDTPSWSENIHVFFPLAQIGQLHLFIELYHVPSNAAAYPIGFCFKSLVDAVNQPALDDHTLLVFEKPYPFPHNKTFYLIPKALEAPKVKETVSINLRLVNPMIIGRGRRQIPQLGCDCSVKLRLENCQWKGICKQVRPLAKKFAAPSESSVLLIAISGNILVCFDVHVTAWDVARKPGSKIENTVEIGSPLLSIFLEECTARPLDESPKDTRLGVFSWSLSHAFEFPTRKAMEACYRALYQAKIGYLRNRLNALPRSQGPSDPSSHPRTQSSLEPRSRVGTVSSAAGSVGQAVIDARGTEQLQNRYRTVSLQLAQVQRKHAHIRASIDRVRDLLENGDGEQ